MAILYFVAFGDMTDPLVEVIQRQGLPHEIGHLGSIRCVLNFFYRPSMSGTWPSTNPHRSQIVHQRSLSKAEYPAMLHCVRKTSMNARSGEHNTPFRVMAVVEGIPQ